MASAAPDVPSRRPIVRVAAPRVSLRRPTSVPKTMRSHELLAEQQTQGTAVPRGHVCQIEGGEKDRSFAIKSVGTISSHRVAG